MGQTLTNGLYLPDEGERYCYDGLASNWTILDAVVGSYNAHIENTTIHITSEERTKWNTGVTQAYVLRYASSSVSANSTVAYSSLDNTDNIKIGDKVLDQDGKLYSVTSVDAANSQITVGSLLIDLSKDSDLSNYYTKAEVDALDSNAMHKTGNETAAGIKTFSDETYIKSLNFTNEVASPSSSSSAVMPIITTITYSDGSPSVQARLNFRVTADGSKSFYPHEAGLYSLGLASRYWDSVYSYMYDSSGKNLGNEFSGNARTNLYLKSNRDTAGQSGLYISKFRQNRAQGEMGPTDVVQVTFDVLENSVRTNRTWYLNYVDWANDVPKTVEIRSLCEKVDYKLTHINGLEPSALGMPDLNNGIDISGYLTVNGRNVQSTYTPSVNGWISIALSRASGAHGIQIIQGNFGSSGNQITDVDGNTKCLASLPVKANVAVTINSALNSTIVWAYFYPCLGNI